MAENIETPTTTTEISTEPMRHLHPILLLVIGIMLVGCAYLSAGAMGAMVVLWGEVVLVLSCAMR